LTAGLPVGATGRYCPAPTSAVEPHEVPLHPPRGFARPERREQARPIVTRALIVARAAPTAAPVDVPTWAPEDEVVLPFLDRRSAGILLATELRALPLPPRTLVVGMMGGGVLVAAQVCRRLDYPLDAIAVQEVFDPSSPATPISAATADGTVLAVRAADEILTQRLVGHEVEAAIAIEETRRRERHVRAWRDADLSDRPVLIVSDGIATAVTATAAVESLRKQGANPITLAAPVGAPDAVRDLRAASEDQIVVLAMPTLFEGVSRCYEYYPEVEDDEIRRLLGEFGPRERP
jgi:putative phosphoribosyl transferase